MAIDLRAYGTDVTSGGATTLAPVVPSTAQDGDLLFLFIRLNTGTAQTFTGLSGWTERHNLNGTAPSIAVYTKICSGDAGATVNPAWTTSTACHAVIAAYSGVDATTPFDDFATQHNTSSSTVNYGLADRPLNNEVILVGATAGNVTISTPTDCTSRIGGNTGFKVSDGAFLASQSSPTSAYAGPLASRGLHLVLRSAVVPVFRESGVIANPNGVTSITVEQPATSVIGDLLIAVVGSTLTTSVWNTPSEWTLVGQSSGTAVFYRFAVAAGSVTTHDFTISTAATELIGVISAFSGVGSVETTASTAISASTSAVSPTLTASGADRLLVSAGGWESELTTATPATGMTERFDAGGSGGSSHAYIADEAVASAVATGTRTHTLSNPTSGVITSLLLAPPANQPKLRSASYKAGNNVASVVADMPVDIVDGDLLIAVVTWQNNVTSITAPSGWTEIESAFTTTPYLKAYTKTASSEGSTASWSWTTSSDVGVIIVCLRGAGTIDVEATVNRGSSPTVAFSSMTTTGAPRLLLFFANWIDQCLPVTSVLGAIQVLSGELSAAHTGDLSYEIQNGAAATGNARTAVSSNDGANIGYAVAVISAASSSGMQMIL